MSSSPVDNIAASDNGQMAEKKGRQSRSGLARIVGAGKPKARDLPPVKSKRIFPSGKVAKTPGTTKKDGGKD